MTEENKARWIPLVYKLTEAAEYPHWALAACADAQGVLHYSLVARQAYAGDAAGHARDYAMMLNANELTIGQEGTTFKADKLPAGAFMTEAEIAVAPRMTHEERMAAVMRDIMNTPTAVSPTKPPRGPRK